MVVRLKDTGDLLASKAQTIVNTVNCRGVMGKGVAAAFRDSGAYGEMVADYERRCAAGEVRLGQPYLWSPPAPVPGSEQGVLFDSETTEPAPSLSVKQVLNFPTKDHWKHPSQLPDIDRGLAHAADQRRKWGIESMAVPALGCGNGRLSWPLIGETLQKWLEDRFPEVAVDLHEPPDGAGGPGWIKPGWIDMAEAMATAGELAEQDGRVRAAAFFEAMARACGGLPGLDSGLPGLDGGRTKYSKQVRRLVHNGVIGYEQNWTERGSLDVSALLAPGPTYSTSIAWRRKRSDPDEAAIRQAAERLVEEIKRLATSRARSSRP